MLVVLCPEVIDRGLQTIYESGLVSFQDICEIVRFVSWLVRGQSLLENDRLGAMWDTC